MHFVCSCGLEPETIHHYFLYCNHCFNLRIELLNDICALNPTSSQNNHEFSLVSIGGISCNTKYENTKVYD